MAALVRIDGRHERAARNRDAVVRAALQLVRKTSEMPTAAEVAALAGISRRTVFRLFEDMESLNLAANRLQRAEVLQRFPPPLPSGQPLAERRDQLIAHRLAVYEFILPLRRLAERLQYESPAVREDLARSHAEFRMHTELMLHDALPACEPERQTRIDALSLLLGFPTWRTLRDDHGLCPDAARAVVATGVERLLEDG